jgi:dihydrolipoamide dehydrogenase
MPDTTFEVLIIGSSPGGYITAVSVAQVDHKAAIVEKSCC